MGAPLKPDRERYPNGRIKQNQGGTAETVARHLTRARSLHIPTSKDPGYAASTIGALEARSLISPDEARVLTSMRETFERLFGKGVPSGSSIERTYGSGAARGEPEETAGLRRAWGEYKDAISRVTPRARRDEFENVILRNRFRQWMTFARLEGQPEFEALAATIRQVVGNRTHGTEMSDAHRQALVATE